VTSQVADSRAFTARLDDVRAVIPLPRAAPAPVLEALAERQMHVAARSLYVLALKPVLDRLVACTLLLVLLPVLVTVAAAVLVSLGRPVLFVQQRIGRHGRTFSVLKFRTMLPDRRHQAALPAAERRVTHKSTADPRHTPVGCFLRRWGLDELPQLLNILRGEMSLVGPRPELPSVVATYERWQHLRHLVKPGLTGWWQVSARGDEPMHHRVDVDLEYVLRPSLGRDVAILLATVPAALKHGGS
jgi:lipopolysaccharide/colanic/teichoic acid biosynthesis glycosyltransferase